MKKKTFIHHYLFDTIFSTVILLAILMKGLQLGMEDDCGIVPAIVLSVMAGLVFELLYWFIVRKLYIKLVLWCYKMNDRIVIRHIERRGIERYRRRDERAIAKDAACEGLSGSQQAELLNFAAEVVKAKELRDKEMKAEAKRKLARVKEYTKNTLLMLNFSAEETFKICNYVEFFVTTRSVIQSPTTIAKRDDVSITELKNLMANIAGQYDIDNITTAKFIAEVFKEWCFWVDAYGKKQTTEVETISKTLRTSKGRLRVLPTADI